MSGLVSSVAAFVNYGLFQVAWFTAVYGAATGQPVVGFISGWAAAMWQIFDLRERNRWEAGLIAAVVGVGIVVEMSFVSLGAISYVGMAPGQIFPPIWIIAMWLAFGTLPHGCLSWMQGRLWTQAILGAIVGPFNYIMSANLGAAVLPDPPLYSIIVISAGWALAIPLIFWLAEVLHENLEPETAAAY